MHLRRASSVAGFLAFTMLLLHQGDARGAGAWPSPVASQLLVRATPSLSHNIPAQYVAKLYTESLGRAPDQAGWRKYILMLRASGCSVSGLEKIGVASQTFFDGEEFLKANPDPQSQVLAMFRAILNRDPDASGFAQSLSELKGGDPPAVVAGKLYAGKEFAAEARTLCGVGQGGVSQPAYNPDYGFGNTPAFQTAPLTKGITQYTELTNALNAAASAFATTKIPQTVELAQAAVIPVTAAVKIPRGVILETSGNPLPRKYTQMARLVRAGPFSAAVVEVHGGGTLENVWVDGQRNVLGYPRSGTDQVNIETRGGVNTVVANNRSSDPQAGSNLLAQRGGAQKLCVSETVSGNLLTGYSTVHNFKETSDGMTVYCENTLISKNQIVDQTDIAIVIMGASYPGNRQTSKITDNTIVSAGNSTNAPLNADAITSLHLTGPLIDGNHTPGPGEAYPCYEGTVFANNTFWTGPYTAFDFALEAGGRPFFAPPRLFDGQCSDGGGPVFTNNGTGSLAANVKIGIVIAGMFGVKITNDGSNPLIVVPSPVLFPKGLPARSYPATMVLMEAGHSGGSVYLPATSKENVDSCTFAHNGV